MMAGIASSAGRRARRSRASATPPEATTTTGRALCWREARSGFRNRPTRGVHRPPVNRRHSRHRARRGVRPRARHLHDARPGETTTGRSPRGVCCPARFRRALDARRGRARVRPRPRGRPRPLRCRPSNPRGRVHPGAPRARIRRAHDPHRAAPASPGSPRVGPRRPRTPPRPRRRGRRAPRHPPRARHVRRGPRRRPIHAQRRDATRAPRRRRAVLRPRALRQHRPRSHRRSLREPILSRRPRRAVRPAGRATRAGPPHPTRRRRRRRRRLGERSGGGAHGHGADGHGHSDARRRTRTSRARHRRRPRARPRAAHPVPAVRLRPVGARRRRRERRVASIPNAEARRPRRRLRGGHPRTDRGCRVCRGGRGCRVCRGHGCRSGRSDASTGRSRGGEERRRGVRRRDVVGGGDVGGGVRRVDLVRDGRCDCRGRSLAGTRTVRPVRRFEFPESGRGSERSAGRQRRRGRRRTSALAVGGFVGRRTRTTAPRRRRARASSPNGDPRPRVRRYGQTRRRRRAARRSARRLCPCRATNSSPRGERRLAAAVDAAFKPPPPMFSTSVGSARSRAPRVRLGRRRRRRVPGNFGRRAAGVARSIRKGIAASSADSSSATSDDHDDEEDRAELERHVRHRAEGEPSREGTGPDARGLVVLVAGVEDLESVPEPLRRCFTHEVEATPPTEAERLAILRECLGPGREPSDREDETVVARGTPRSAAARSAAKSEDRTPRMRGTPETPGTPGTPRMPGSSGVPGMSLGTSPVATAPSSSPVPDFPDFPGTPRASTSSPRPFSARDLESAAASSSGASPRDVRALAAEAALSAPLGTPITSANLADAVRWSERRTASAIGAPTVPATTWEDVGGLEDVKAAIRDVVELPLKRPDLFAARAGSNSGGVDGRSGALLYGPPGTGKTLLAKAVAASAPFASSASRVPNSSTCTWARASETCRVFDAETPPRRAWCSSTSWTRSPPGARARTAAG